MIYVTSLRKGGDEPEPAREAEGATNPIFLLIISSCRIIAKNPVHASVKAGRRAHSPFQKKGSADPNDQLTPETY